MRAPLRSVVVAKDPSPTEAPIILPAEDLLLHVYVLIDDAIAAGEVTIPARPGPTPACSDAELLTIALVRHLLGRRSESGFVAGSVAEVAHDWAHLFPRLPHQSEANRRIRWLWAAFEQVRAGLVARCPVDDCAQIDTGALPVNHPSRVRGPDGLGRPPRPGRPLRPRRRARRVVLRLPTRDPHRPGSRLVRAWRIVPAAVNEHDVATDLLAAGQPPRDVLLDKGFTGRAFTAACAARGIAVLTPPTKAQRAGMPSALHCDRLLAQLRGGHLR